MNAVTMENVQVKNYRVNITVLVTRKINTYTAQIAIPNLNNRGGVWRSEFKLSARLPREILLHNPIIIALVTAMVINVLGTDYLKTKTIFALPLVEHLLLIRKRIKSL